MLNKCFVGSNGQSFTLLHIACFAALASCSLCYAATYNPYDNSFEALKKCKPVQNSMQQKEFSWGFLYEIDSEDNAETRAYKELCRMQKKQSIEEWLEKVRPPDMPPKYKLRIDSMRCALHIERTHSSESTYSIMDGSEEKERFNSLSACFAWLHQQKSKNYWNFPPPKKMISF